VTGEEILSGGIGGRGEILGGDGSTIGLDFFEFSTLGVADFFELS